jgi:hypothetical protein
VLRFFENLQNSAFTDWLLGSESIWMYPTVLTLHTVGLAVLVGASVILHLRMLGVGNGVPVRLLGTLYSFIWPAFAVNLVSGLVLFVTQAGDRVTQPLFYVKLLCIAAALWLGQVAKRSVFDGPEAAPIPARMRSVAVAALALWVGAIVTGRLMAYFTN